MTNARSIAVDILNKVLKGRFVDDCLAADENIHALEARDKNFVVALLYTTLRHLGEIDHFLQKFTREKYDVLRLGVAQIKIMDMPPYAVVNEMVSLAERRAFCNAILRKVPEYEMEVSPKLNIPKWIYGGWKKAYGEEKANKIAELCMKEPPLDITLKAGFGIQGLGFGEELNPRSPTPEPLPNGSIRLWNAGRIEELPGYQDGQWWVQDASSTFAVEMLGDVAGKNILDMCAAPGGKSAQLIDKGAKVTALDDSPRRVGILRENLARLNFEAEIIAEDGRTFGGRKFDAILLDAPCTATGTIRRNPEVLHHRTEADLKNLVKTQKELIDNCHNLLEPGGVLVYSVCSLQYEEGEGLVKKLDTTKWRVESEKRILPCDWADVGGIGGSYAAKLIRL